MQRLEMFQDVVINQVVARRIAECRLRNFVREGNSQPRKRDVALIPHGYGSFAVAAHGHMAVVVNGGHALISAVKLGPASDVFGVAVRERGADQDALLLSSPVEAVAGKRGQARAA